MQEKIVNNLICLAKKAAKKGEIPVSAVIVKDNEIIATAYNKREKNHDILGHAEVLVIKKTSRKLKTWKLTDCDLYVSLKPCAMCEEVIKQSRLRNVYYLIERLDYKKEYSRTNVQEMANYSTIKEEYQKILQNFFKEKRHK